MDYFLRMKRTSPTAYCDCWEKCKCKSLIAGQQGPRFDLLSRVLTDTDLVTLPNSRYVWVPVNNHMIILLKTFICTCDNVTL